MGDAQYAATVTELRRVTLGGRPGRPELEVNMIENDPPARRYGPAQSRRQRVEAIRLAKKNPSSRRTP